jgi:hypothetical protein
MEETTLEHKDHVNNETTIQIASARAKINPDRQ